ncbi:hypothetical protein RGI99_000085 [Morganella morganii]|uniref:AbiTii domain-containing protein n=1 Tax=Morganella morganii TaxID=582 RepID=UPI000F6375F9|nr:hypothetical protein [Morganella morganii]EKW8498970.1 hypothetical protein [Morganella morganii]ELA7730089.1 hypothetical protein [Morganella morganii]ELA7776600.1 hypothetical protein [Morganella morganii]MBT0454824.1 hypothetical protein [Morganella morganii subsp. morganii]MBT0487561.1 hypothetical protein [Morganella morganii subsp. morganii]
MSILHEIQRDAMNEDSSISNLLRKCLFLARKTGSDQFKKWVFSELNGYDPESDIPEYRVLSCQSKGDFSRVDGIFKNLDIDIDQLDDEFYDLYGECIVSVSIASIADLVSGAKNADSAVIRRPWEPSMVSRVSDKIYRDMNCLRAWSETPTPLFLGILDKVKTMILDFALDLEEKLPNIEDVKLSKQDEKIVTQTFNTHVYGDASIANASENFNQSIQSQSDELINKLVTELVQLKGQGTDTNIIDAVIPHIEEIKHIKNQKGVMDKVASIMTIAGGSASVCALIAPYIPMLSNLFG